MLCFSIKAGAKVQALSIQNKYIRTFFENFFRGKQQNTDLKQDEGKKKIKEKKDFT